MSNIKHFLSNSSNKKNLKKLLFYILLYTLTNFFYGEITGFFHGYKASIQDNYLAYIPVALLSILAATNWEKFSKISQSKSSTTQRIISFIIAAAILLIPLTSISEVSKSSSGISSIPITVIALYLQLLLGNIFLFLAIYGSKFFKAFTKESIMIIFTIMLYMSVQFLVENNWENFSIIITESLNFILPLISDKTYIDLQTYNIRMHEFNAYIGPPCAGIYSLATFTFLYLLTIFFIYKNKRIDPFKSFIALLIGLIVIFALNIIRITIIILVGAYISERLAIDLFHEYLSAIFLIALFMLYLYKIIPRILEEKTKI